MSTLKTTYGDEAPLPLILQESISNTASDSDAIKYFLNAIFFNIHDDGGWNKDKNGVLEKIKDNFLAHCGGKHFGGNPSASSFLDDFDTVMTQLLGDADIQFECVEGSKGYCIVIKGSNALPDGGEHTGIRIDSVKWHEQLGVKIDNVNKKVAQIIFILNIVQCLSVGGDHGGTFFPTHGR
jgi:hypothetical protein